VAGLILWQIERVPAVGEHIDYGGYRFEVVDMDGRKIDKVLAAPLTQPCNESEESAGG
jgi:putative hemolysin